MHFHIKLNENFQRTIKTSKKLVNLFFLFHRDGLPQKPEEATAFQFSKFAANRKIILTNHLI